MGLRVLAGIAENGKNEAARVAACVHLLDRGWGRPPQSHTGEDGKSDIRVVIRHIVDGRDVELNERDAHATQIEHQSNINDLQEESG
jgi:hypothetical protein